jgi:hypothetical protein
MPPQSTSSIVAQHQQFHAQSMQQPSTSAHHPHNLIHLGANQQASSNVMQQNLVQTQQATTFDAGRTLVTAPPRNLEPVFVASASNPVQIRRVLHSEAYVK